MNLYVTFVRRRLVLCGCSMFWMMIDMQIEALDDLHICFGWAHAYHE